MRYVGNAVRSAVENCIETYPSSRLASLLGTGAPLVIKFVSANWARHYATPKALKISETPALTWGTATYVTPLHFPLSSVLYGRIGLVCALDPTDLTGWRVFDATQLTARRAYRRWIRTQPSYADLVLTVHSTHSNHLLRNRFREAFGIDCVLFHPDQAAEKHTNVNQHVWMAVTDWVSPSVKKIRVGLSQRLARARFTVLIDEEFDLLDAGLPIRSAPRKIEPWIRGASPQMRISATSAAGSGLPAVIQSHFSSGGYVHVAIDP